MKYLAIILAFLCSTAYAADVPALKGPVNDLADVLTKKQEDALTNKLLASEGKTSNQVVVLMIRSLDGQDIEGYANKVFNAWHLGAKKEINKPSNNGVLFVVAVNDRKMRIEVGYGHEGTLTDAVASQIINEDVAPLFKQSDFDKGINLGVDQIEKTISGQAFVASPKGESVLVGILGIILFVVFFLVCAAINHPVGSAIVGGIFGFFIALVLFSLLWSLVGLLIGVLVGFIAGLMGLDGVASLADSSGSFSSSSGGSSYSGGGGSSGGGGASGSW